MIVKWWSGSSYLLVIVIALIVSTATSAQSNSQLPPQQESRSDGEKETGSSQEKSTQPVGLTKAATPLYSQYVDSSNGITVETLINQAGQRSKDILAARQTIAIIQGRLIQAGLRPNPTIDTEYSTDKLGTREGEYEFSASYIQPIELGGKRKKRMTVAQLEFAQAEKELLTQEQRLIADIRSQYAEALAATENLRVTEQLIAINENTFRITEVRFQEGDVAKLDVNLVRVELNRLRTQLLQAENRVKAAVLQLKTLAGLGVEEPLRLRSDLFSAPAFDSLSLEVLQAAALEQRPDLAAARIGEEVAEARIALTKAEAVPDVNLFGRFQQEKSIFGETPLGRLEDTDRKVAFGVSIPLPINNRNQGAIAEAAATRVQARHRREFLEQVIKRDVVLAFTKLQTARDTIALYKNEILPRSQENLRVIRTAYDLGEQQLLDVVAEQRRLIEAQQQYTDALKEYYLSIIELERAVGAPIR